MSSNLRLEPVTFWEQVPFVLLLITGLYFPTSINGEHSVQSVIIAFALLFLLLAYVAWKHGVWSTIVAYVSLPIVIILAGCTLFAFVSGPVDFDTGLFTKFSALAGVLALDLRQVRSGRLVKTAFVLVNLLNIACGIAILAGSEWIVEILPRYYWISDENLLPMMLSLRKPVLTFGTHSLAGLYLYLFFFVNWEGYKLTRKSLSLIFALSYFILLLGLTSFTSLGLGGLAAAQMGVWLWRHNRKVLVVLTVCVAGIVPSLATMVVDQIGSSKESRRFAETFMNSDLSGPVARFGPGGELRNEMSYLYGHAFSPVGLRRSESAFDVASAEHFYLGDSGPLEYLVRGSGPLVFLIYFGLYRFLRNNLTSRTQSTVIFLVIVVFEIGYSALSSARTYFLLPIFVTYLNDITLRADHRCEFLSDTSGFSQ